MISGRMPTGIARLGVGFCTGTKPHDPNSLNRVLGDLTRLRDYLLLAKASAKPIHSTLVKTIPFQYAPAGKPMNLERVLTERAPWSFRRDVIHRDLGRF
jgi:hypothetical protein